MYSLRVWRMQQEMTPHAIGQTHKKCANVYIFQLKFEINGETIVWKTCSRVGAYFALAPDCLPSLNNMFAIIHYILYIYKHVRRMI